MKEIFKGKVMSFSGDFGSEKGWTYEQMTAWVRAHGGTHVREVDEYTTHLICTIEDFKKKTAQGTIGSKNNSFKCVWNSDPF